MTTSGGYAITQYPTRNEIVITLPQTLNTLTNTVTEISNRRNKLTDIEEATLLIVVKAMFENGTKMDEMEDKSECVVGCDGYCEECPMGRNGK